MERYALIGHNISYSKSPLIHKIIYSQIGVDGDYSVFSLQSSELAPFCQYARENLRGFNITKPYKEQILPWLDYCDGKSINTVVNRDGKLYGYSTDAYGFSKDIQIKFGKTNGKALVLGAGGVSKVIIPALKELGHEVFVFNRTKEKAEKLCKEFGVNMALRYKTEPNLVVNCTSYGFNRGENPMFDETGEFLFPTKSVKWAYDTIYTPLQTDFLRSLNCNKANGVGMLILQAVQADRLMCNKTIDEQTEKQIYDLAVKSIIKEIEDENTNN